MKQTLTVASLFLTFVVGCSSASTELSPESQVDIYKAVIGEVYFVDHSFHQPPMWSTIYIHRMTEDLILNADAPYGDNELIPNEIQQGLSAELNDIPADVIWIDDDNEAPSDPQNGRILDGEGVILTLGNIHFQEDGSALVSFWLHCGSLCGIGKTYVLEEINGVWQVTGSTGVEIMS